METSASNDRLFCSEKHNFVEILDLAWITAISYTVGYYENTKCIFNFSTAVRNSCLKCSNRSVVYEKHLQPTSWTGFIKHRTTQMSFFNPLPSSPASKNDKKNFSISSCTPDSSCSNSALPEDLRTEQKICFTLGSHKSYHSVPFLLHRTTGLH